jgi:sortase A
MRLVVAKQPLRRLLRWARRALFACGVLLLAYCGFVAVDAGIFQGRESHNLDRLLPQAEGFASSKGAPAGATDGVVGRIDIPRILLSAVVVEGIDQTALRRAVGHIPGTALPGEAGNVGLAGHRDTFFRRLRNLRIRDEIRFSTMHGSYKYEVESLKVVEPDNIGVLAPSGENVLTMVTCYPFYYVGPAPKRWIVRARQVAPITVPSSVER